MRAEELAWLRDGDVAAVERICVAPPDRIGWATTRWYALHLDLVRGREPQVASLLAACTARRGQPGVPELRAACLTHRFAYAGDSADLDEAIDVWRRSLDRPRSTAYPVWLSPAWCAAELAGLLPSSGPV